MAGIRDGDDAVTGIRDLKVREALPGLEDHTQNFTRYSRQTLVHQVSLFPFAPLVPVDPPKYQVVISWELSTCVYDTWMQDQSLTTGPGHSGVHLWTPLCFNLEFVMDKQRSSNRIQLRFRSERLFFPITPFQLSLLLSCS